MQQPEEGMLSPYRILDLADRKALLAGKVLGNFGADVIKIERPGGDPARDISPFYKDQAHPEKSLYWFYCNTSKRGITLDIAKPGGRELFKRLVKTADAIIESFEPGYMASLGLGYDDLCKIKPDVVMTSVSPFGQTGPYAHFKHSNLTTWSMGGQTYISGEPARQPIQRYLHQADFAGGLHGALGTMMALTHRDLSGQGQHVDVSIQQAVILTLMVYAEYWDVLKVVQRRTGRQYVTPRAAPYGPLTTRGVYPCKDGYIVSLGFRGGTAGHIAICEAIRAWGLSEGYMQEIKDYDFRQLNQSTISQAERDVLDNALAAFVLTKTKQELMDRAAAEELQFAPCNTVEDLFNSAHFRARGFWDQVVDHPELGDAFPYPGAPIDTSEGAWLVRRRAPLIGEHNDEIYVGELGLGREQFTALKANGII
ncbi:MAG: CoA transferase [Chloroflexi bacterium]|nr:CoA transferase [Chloroflexota bacterium]